MPTLPLPPPVHIEEFAGDQLVITLEFQQSTGAARSKNATWTGQVRTAVKGGTLFASFTVDDSSESSGIVVFSVAGATTLTAELDRNYHFSLVETPASGGPFTHMRGTVVWRPQVTA